MCWLLGLGDGHGHVQQADHQLPFGLLVATDLADFSDALATCRDTAAHFAQLGRFTQLEAVVEAGADNQEGLVPADHFGVDVVVDAEVVVSISHGIQGFR